SPQLTGEIDVVGVHRLLEETLHQALIELSTYGSKLRDNLSGAAEPLAEGERGPVGGEAYSVSAGAEGDPVSLAIKRATTFWNRKSSTSDACTSAGESELSRNHAS